MNTVRKFLNAHAVDIRHAVVAFVVAFALQLGTPSLGGTAHLDWKALSAAAIAAGVGVVRKFVPDASLGQAVTVLLRAVGRSKTPAGAVEPQAPAPPA